MWDIKGRDHPLTNFKGDSVFNDVETVPGETQGGGGPLGCIDIDPRLQDVLSSLSMVPMFMRNQASRDLVEFEIQGSLYLFYRDTSLKE
uniref:Uncharacterized protein n=1 Tax=viral metagenome TaxID=1070528 RepID=A0A6M3K0U7_9ZZZZ